MSGEERANRKPFRAVDVLSGRIDQRIAPAAKPVRARKQISAQLEPEQVRLLGELHARLNATATERIEKSDLVGLGIELLAAVLDEVTASRALDPEPGRNGARPAELATVADVRAYAHTHVRATGRHDRVQGGRRAARGVSRPESGGSAIEE